MSSITHVTEAQLAPYAQMVTRMAAEKGPQRSVFGFMGCIDILHYKLREAASNGDNEESQCFMRGIAAAVLAQLHYMDNYTQETK